MGRVRALPSTRGGFVEFFWAVDDPEIVAQQLLQLSANLDNFIKPLAVSAEFLRADISRRFKTGTDPSGRAWEPWSENYEPWALRHTRGPVLPDRANLHLTGQMKSSVLDPDNWRVTRHDVFFDTTGVDDKWAWHNFGTDDRNSAINAEIEGFGGIGYEANVLPPRPFIGTSPVTESKIAATFDAWFRGELTAATSSKGKAFFRHTKRDASGRFSA